MRTGNTLRQHRRALRFHCYNLNIRVLGLQVSTHAADGSAGSNASNKDIYRSIGIIPDFHTCGLFMDCRVGWIGKLGWNEAVRQFRCQFVCLFDGALHPLCTLGQYQFCTICLHQVPALNAHGFRHGDNQAIASCCCNRSQTNSGVAAGRFNEDTARLQQTLCFCIVHHCLGDSILYAASRIEVFQLAEQLGFQVFVLFQMSQFQQRRFSNQIGNFLINMHKYRSFLTGSLNEAAGRCHPNS